MFAKVLEFNSEYVKEADREWNLVQKIQRAMPGTVTGKTDCLCRKDHPGGCRSPAAWKNSRSTFSTRNGHPENLTRRSRILKRPGHPLQRPRSQPRDIVSHPLKADIEGILQLGVRGLELYPDGTFRPGDLVDRATYAMMIEDILIKVSGDNGLATRFIGERLLFLIFDPIFLILMPSWW